jgi:hypothetical protein
MVFFLFGVFVNGFQNSHMQKYYARSFASLCLAMSKSLLHNQKLLFVEHFHHVFVIVVIGVV